MEKTYTEVFNKASIYEMFFFNVKAVLEYKTLKELLKKNSLMHKQWETISRFKYSGNTDEETYQKYAIYHPEFCKIVSITYATVYSEDSKLKRNFKKISNIDEYEVISVFFEVLMAISSEGYNSSPKYLPILTGHNIMNFDIPLLMKKFLLYRERLKEENIIIPLILSKYLISKPWESNVVDTVNLWKFNGNNYVSLPLIADFLNLKKTVDLLTPQEISDFYWKNVKKDEEKTLDDISLQSATETNLVIQLINEIRQFS